MQSGTTITVNQGPSYAISDHHHAIRDRLDAISLSEANTPAPHPNRLRRERTRAP